MDFETLINEAVRQGFSVIDTSGALGGFGDRGTRLSLDGANLCVVSDKGQISVWIELIDGKDVDLSDLARAADLCGVPPVSGSTWETASILELLQNIREVIEISLRLDVIIEITSIWAARTESFRGLVRKSNT